MMKRLLWRTRGLWVVFEGLEATYDRAKLALPTIIPASLAGEGVPYAKLPIDHHNGLYGFDIDKGDIDAPALLALIKQAPGAVMAGVSVSGKALWCIFARTCGYV